MNGPVLWKIGQHLTSTRDAVTFSSLCHAVRELQWEGEMIVSARWWQTFPPPVQKSLNCTTLTFKRYGAYHKEMYAQFREALETLRYQCCRVPYRCLMDIVGTLHRLRHLSVHLLDPDTAPGGPNLADVLALPHLQTLDITLASPDQWGIIYISPETLSRSLHTLRLKRAQHIWVEGTGTGEWPRELRTLDLQSEMGVFVPLVPESVQHLTIHSPQVPMDDEVMFREGAKYPDMKSVDIRGRGAFGLTWLQHTPLVTSVRVCVDTVIIDRSLAYPKHMERVVLESRAYFAIAGMPWVAIDRIRRIPFLDVRASGGKLIDLFEYL